MTEVLVTAVARGVAALLRGHVKGTDHDRLLPSTEPGLVGGLGVAVLILGTFINALHAVSAAVLVITSVPKTLSEFDLSVNVVFANWVGDSIWHTHGPKRWWWSENWNSWYICWWLFLIIAYGNMGFLRQDGSHFYRARWRVYLYLE